MTPHDFRFMRDPRSRRDFFLNSALDLENSAVAAYTAGAALLKGDALAVGKQFLAQEQEHADGLTAAPSWPPARCRSSCAP